MTYNDQMVPKHLLDRMARYYISLTEGDTHLVEEAYGLMETLGYVDKDGFEL